MKFNTLACSTLKQPYHFLELKLFRIKYLPSDICFTVHVVFKVSINTAESSPITGFRGVKDCFLNIQSYRNTKKSKVKAENSEKGNQMLQRHAEWLKKIIIRIRTDVLWKRYLKGREWKERNISSWQGNSINKESVRKWCAGRNSRFLFLGLLSLSVNVSKCYNQIILLFFF